jgi:hypothetical protein
VRKVRLLKKIFLFSSVMILLFFVVGVCINQKDVHFETLEGEKEGYENVQIGGTKDDEVGGEQIEHTLKAITMDEVKKLSAKKNLTLDDLYMYNKIQSGKGYSYYMFTYQGEDYTLDIYESEQGEIEGVRLVRQNDYLSIDIRNGNIEHLLSSEVSVQDYLTLQLPEGMSIGTYDMYMTGFGGSRIDNEATVAEKNPCGKIRLMHGDVLTFTDGRITNIHFYDNCFYIVSMNSIDNLSAPCIFMELKEEETTEWWAAYFAKEDVTDIGYLIELRKDIFTKEEAKRVIESVQFCERAFGNL